MTGNVRGRVVIVILFASVFQGCRTSRIKKEAFEGEDVTLPCFVGKKTDSIYIESIEWRKNLDFQNKVALYSSQKGVKLFWQNVTMEPKLEGKRVIGASLNLPGVTKWDSGVFICDTATFPLGSIRTEIELIIKEISIICNVTGPVVEIYEGENVTIECGASLANTQYRWTKNRTVLSENGVLQLKQVTAENAGEYAFHVTAGEHRQRKEFVVAVRSPTTSLQTDPVTASSHTVAHTTEINLATPSFNSRPLTTSQSTGANNLSTTSATASAVERLTASTESPRIGDSSLPSESSVTSGRLTPSKSDHPDTMSWLTHGKATESELHTSKQDHTVSPSPQWTVTSGNTLDDLEKAGTKQTLSTGVGVQVQVDRDKDSGRSHHILALILIPVLLLLAVLGFLCRRQIRKERLDMPPPFKPPPPPVKYTTSRYTRTSQPFLSHDSTSYY